ncbi:MAG TPA: DEDD exonuclease domain-containing protein [Actinomycetales bacterium]|nr:DEDD exonuclease domain-containing protein [Actinomycetales bacterium]
MVQGTLDELGTPLHDVTFVVVDLETTGGSPLSCAITEIGAVKVRGGEVVGELSTLVNPGTPIPPFISLLTGITDAMVVDAPRVDAALTTFLEFARGSVLVAHNAPFDISFLKAATAASGRDWPGFTVVDTVHLARQVLSRGEVPNRKLSTLARLFGSPDTPDHRALHDARATVHVLHGLLERVGSLGVHSLEELCTFSSRVSPAQRRKRYLAEGLPSAPGVYLFRDGQGEVLYVGTSVDIRARVRTYFTASEHRTRMAEMVALAERVDPVVCATRLEAQVRELRLIAEHAPRYNRRSRRPERAPWVKLTAEPFPRLSVVREVRDDGSTYVGPFSGSRAAEQAIDALHDVFPLRQCRRRLGHRGGGSACALAEMGRCGAPCTRAADEQQRDEVVAEYARVVDDVRTALSGDCRQVTDALRARIRELAQTERFEQAALVRDRMLVLVRTTARAQRVIALARCPEIVAARRGTVGGWEIALVRHGRLAGTTTSPRGADPWPYVDALRVTGEVVPPPVLPLPAALPEEAEKVLAWLEQDGTRLVQLTGSWSCPVHGAGAERLRLDPVAAAIGPVDPFDAPWHPVRSTAAAG